MPFVESEILINSDPKKVYDLAKNMEDFPNYMRDVEEVNVLERRDNGTITEWVTNIDGTPIIWTEEDVFDDNDFLINFKMIEGDLDVFEGTWKFVKENGSCKVVLGVDFDFGMPSLTDLIGPTLETKLRENSEMMLSGLKTKTESN